MSGAKRLMTVRLWVLSGVFLAAAGGLHALTSYQEELWEEAAEPLTHSLSTLPTELAGFEGRDLQMSQHVLDALGAQDWIKRSYADRTGRSFVVYVGYFGDFSIMKSHSPEVCYPGSGWDVRSQKKTVLRGAGDETLEVNLLEFSKHGERQAVINWFLTWGGAKARMEEAKWQKLVPWMLRKRGIVRLQVSVNLEEQAGLPPGIGEAVLAINREVRAMLPYRSDR